MSWTRIVDPETVVELLPPWFGTRMVGVRGSFGLLLSTGEVLRLTSITAAHQSSEGLVFLDVLLDESIAPEGVASAWQAKQFLGAPVAGATLASVNLAHVISAIEFSATEMAAGPNVKITDLVDALEPERPLEAPSAIGSAGD